MAKMLSLSDNWGLRDRRTEEVEAAEEAVTGVTTEGP